MRKRSFALVLGIVMACNVLFSACADFANQPDYNTIDTPYIYPVLPGTEQWQSLSMDERIASCHVEEKIVKNMTTEAVLITTLKYPFIVNIFAHGEVGEGIDAVKGYCTPLAELLNRDDALQVISSYLNETADTESVEYLIAADLREYIQDSIFA